MTDGPPPQKVPLIFFRTESGREPVREWLKGLPEIERPVGMPLCRPLQDGMWEIRTDLPTKRTARVQLCFYRGYLVALHGFIKKTRTTPDQDFALARKLQKELEQ